MTSKIAGISGWPLKQKHQKEKQNMTEMDKLQIIKTVLGLPPDATDEEIKLALEVAEATKDSKVEEAAVADESKIEEAAATPAAEIEKVAEVESAPEPEQADSTVSEQAGSAPAPTPVDAPAVHPLVIQRLLDQIKACDVALANLSSDHPNVGDLVRRRLALKEQLQDLGR